MTFLSPPSSSPASSSTSTTTKPSNRLYSHSNNSSSRASTPNNPLPGPSTLSTSTSPAPAISSTLSLPLHSKPHHTHHREHHGMRAHLAEFLPLPRQALFDVKLTIHQLWNVPLVSGDFSVKWKFQHVHREKGGTKRPGTPSANAGAFLQAPSTPTTTSEALGTASSSNGRRTPDNTELLSTNGVPAAFVTRSTSASGSVSGKGKGREASVPMLNVHVDHDPERNSVIIPSDASMLSIPSTSEGSCSSPSLSSRANSMDFTDDPTGAHTSRKNSFGNGAGNVNGSNGNLDGNNGGGSAEDAEFSHEARGRTPYVALRDHHVKFGQTVIVTVHIAIQRDTHELHPCELKLVVEQLSSPNDPAPQNPRLGAVYLNLAEYVDKGAVTRRHLLRESKTNATLQLTIELIHVGGESNYRAPPLQKGEVMAGVSALLEKTAVGGAPRPRPAYDRNVSRPTVKTHRRGTDRRDVFGIGGAGIVEDDLGRPSTALGGGAIGLGIGGIGELGGPGLGAGTGVVGSLKTTENIIEAIFNPVPSSSPAPSPFTYYVPPRPPAAPIRSLSLKTTNTARSSLRSGSISTGGSGSGIGNGDVDFNDVGDAEEAAEHDLDPSPNFDAASILAPSVTSRTSRISRRSDRSLPASFATTASSASHQSSQSLEELGNGKGRDGANTVDKSGSGSGSGSGVGKKWWKRFGGDAKNEGEGVGDGSASANPRPSSPLPHSYHHPHPLQHSQTQSYSQDWLHMHSVSPDVRAQLPQETHTHTHTHTHNTKNMHNTH